MNTIICRSQIDNCWLQFENPIEVFKTNSIEEVLPILEEVASIVKTQKKYAAGFISYEASPAFDSALKTHKSEDFPYIYFGIFDKVEKLKTLNASTDNRDLETNLKFQLPFSKATYLQKIAKIKEYIRKGDTYQVNFTFRQLADFQLDPYRLFTQIAQDAPYAAFVDFEDYAICSASPELFFKIENGQISSKPMKGTAPRGRFSIEDQDFKNELLHSQKDRSENVMIVDMIRNDMAKIAEIGSVKTPKLFEIEKYPSVFQMTSTVMGQTQASLTEVMKAMFPCASITGAPKIWTTDIIKELEQSPRKIYTGSIGFLTPNGNMQFNVAIRTALIDKQKQQLEYGVGGGIVWKSNAEKEFDECLLKSKVIREPKNNSPFSLLETLLWEPKLGYFLLDKHVDRLTNSADYFDFKLNHEKIHKQLEEVSYLFENQKYRIRLLSEKSGKFSIQYFPILKDSENEIKSIQLAKTPVDSSNLFLFHKTTNRSIYEDAVTDFPNEYDVLLWNEKEELTEFTKGNLVVRWNGKLYTPPVSSGLLAGTFRAELLEKKIIQEMVIPKSALPEIEDMYFINSVRKWQRVDQNLIKSSLSNVHSAVFN